MASKEYDQHLNPEDKKFRECILTGDDFMKIEIYRQAAAWYRNALAIRPEDAPAKQKLEDAVNKIKAENKAIYIILSLAAAIIILTAILT